MRNPQWEVKPRVEPPVRYHVLSPAHESLVSTKIQRELRFGVIRRWGEVGMWNHPALSLPVGVEPSVERRSLHQLVVHRLSVRLIAHAARPCGQGIVRVQRRRR